jgi:phosphoribosylaminoimidazole carboxylase PurE protein
MSNPVVALLMGSKSDLPKLEPGIEILKRFEVPHSIRVMSAHRTPDVVRNFTLNAQGEGYKVIIAAAGGAAHLAGVVAAHTLLPVIGIPVEGGPFKGMDALLATVQMPAGVPVATVAVGGAGSTNAALLALRILALIDADMRERLERFCKSQGQAVIDADVQLQAEV